MSSDKMHAGRIGLISDTHGLLRDEALLALRGSDLIIHAGDVGKPEILDALKALAPVVAVRGNVDQADWAATLPSAAVAETEAATFYVLHNLQQLDLDPKAAGFHVVVSGHTHNPKHATPGHVLSLNPPSAPPRRSDHPVTTATLHPPPTPRKP